MTAVSLGTTVLLSFLCLAANAQDDLNVHGIVSDAMSTAKLTDVQISVKKDGVAHNTYATRANGKYEFYLLCGHKYEFIFKKPGFVDRKITIDAKNIPEEVIGAGIIMPTDMSMYAIVPAMEGADLSVFDKPIGIAAYDPILKDLVWDFEHTNKVKAEIFAFIRDIDKKTKELTKETTAADKAKEAEEAKFQAFVKAGDAAMLKQDFAAAVTNYKSATDIRTDDATVNAKLKDAETKLTAKLAAEKLEKDYSTALDAADGFLRTEEFDSAVAKYEEASKLKPAEKYPKDKIAEVKALIAANSAQLAKQKEFDTLVQKGDGHVEKTEFAPAIAAYESALKIFADKKDVQQKLIAAQASLKKLELETANNAAYQVLISEADAKFNSGEFEAAKVKYQEAQKLKPAETYPPERVGLCDDKIAQIAKAAQNQAAFDAFMVKGDAAMDKKSYPEAVTNYESAVGLIPDNAKAIAKLNEAKGLMAEQQAQADKKKQYDALIVAADADFKNESMDEALGKYQQARDVIPAETYPLDQINKINTLLAAKAAANEAEKAYADAMAAGQTAVESKDYNEAISQFNAALAVKQGDKPALKALDDATKLKAAFDSDLATRKAYDELIAKADAAFSANDLENSRKDYEAALKILNEPYPKDQIAIIDGKLTELANQKAEAEKQAELQAKFNKALLAGDAAMAKADFAEAINRYEEALILIPEEPAASKKLADAQKALDAKLKSAALDDQYKDALKRGDDKFKADALTEARDAYQQALVLKADEAYPKDQIKLIDETIAKRDKDAADAIEKERLETIAALLLEGDNLVKSKKFEEGIVKYEEALEIAPERSDIQTKINDARDAMLAAMEGEAIEKAYTEAIAKADAAYKSEQLEDALSEYKTAQSIKQNEIYPKDRIKLIEETIAKRDNDAADAIEKERLETIAALLLEGDNLVKSKKFEEGIVKYEEALVIAPERSDIQTKINDARDAMLAAMEGEAIDAAYSEAIAKADAAFNSEQLEDALSGYKTAQSIKQNEVYPKDRIKLIEETIAKRDKDAADALEKERLETIAALLLAGDNFIKDKKYDDGILKYEEALSFAPERSDIQTKIDEARDAMLAAMEGEAIDAAYSDAINKADAAYGDKDYDGALKNYNTASGIKANEPYPKQKIEEINALLDAQSKADEDRRKAAILDDFNRMVKEGDEYFNKNSFTLALTSFENALSLIPDSEVVIAKIAATNKALADLNAEKSAEEAYEAIISEADGMFQAESYEMAKMKYSDALAQRPGDSYPAKQIAEIDRLLENRLLADESARTAKIDKDYLDAIAQGDSYFSGKAYEDAILAYENALDVKPTESYPQVQIERAQQLMLEREERESERKKREALALEEEMKRKARTDPNYQTVSNNSELQAEAFMREARLAEEREKYERIKKLKIDDSELRTDWELKDEMDRLAIAHSLSAYADGESERFKTAMKDHEERVAKSADNKEALYSNMNRASEINMVGVMDAYSEVLQQIEVQADRNSEWERMQKKRIMGDRALTVIQLDQIENWGRESYEKRLQLNEQLREEAVKHYSGNVMADLERQENSRKLTEDAAAISKVESRRAEENLQKIRQVGADQQVYKDGLEAIMQDRNKAKVEAGQQAVNAERDRTSGSLDGRRVLADEKRMASLEELRKMQEKDPAGYTDVFRSELAQLYPQGVTEESSTLGNKVIITRVVVKGNRGDEYRKVLDKAGNYYFKNGQSISETTWNRETIDAFYKKD